MKTTGTIMKSKTQHLLLISFAFIAVFFITCVNTAVMAQTGAVISSVIVSDDSPEYGDHITATINIDLSGVNAPDNALGSYTGTLNWNTAVLAYESHSGAPPSGFSGVVNTTSASSGQIMFNGANSSGATGNIIVLNVTFTVAGSGTCTLDLSYSAMAAASTFNSLAGILSVNDDVLTATGSVTGIVTLDGAVSSGTADDVSSISIPHTTGTGSNRLMLVGVSWNCGTADRTISSVTFTPSGGSAVAFTNVITQLGYSSSNPRYSAIYSLVNPPSGQAGTVTITFSGSVSNGIMAGVANFAGVNQTLPLGTPGGANAQSANISVSLTGLTGNELIFDNAFLGASSSSATLTADANQTQLWNPAYVANLREAVSTKQATGSSVTMSWTASSSSYWAIVAVPINPAPAGPTYILNIATNPAGGGNTNPSLGTHSYAENEVVNITATPATGYDFVNWTGSVADPNSASTTVTMNDNKTVTANFVQRSYNLTVNTDANGSVTLNPSGGTYASGTIVTLTPVPGSGYQFSNWSGANAGDVINSGGIYTIVMNGNKAVSAEFSTYVPSPLGLDGAVSSGTADDVSSISIPHTTGTGSNRLMLVGVSWNCGTADRTISSVTFTPSGGTAVAFTKVITQLGYSTSNPRYSAIYSLVNPPSGQAGTVTITFSGSVSNGIMAGVANFAGVNQTLPLGTPGGANAQSANISVSLTGLTGNELIFDNAFLGSSSDTYTLTPGANQTQLWNPAYVANIRSAASTKQATSSSVTMSWTASSSSYWAITAVPIIPIGVLSNDAYNILLGRPTNHSITINTIIDMDGDVYYEYGTTSANYSAGQTSVQHANAGEPVETVITGLATNTKYFYRLKFLPSGSSTWASGSEYSFNTQRADNETFTFTLISDSHLGQTFSGNTPARYNQTTLNVAADHPDFHLDLGDAFIMEATENQTEANAVYQDQRNYFGNFSHSTPVFLAIGNHENEEGWNLDDTPFSTGLGSIIARKEYFLNPAPDAFYSGDDSLLLGVGGDQLREDYYAWEWGDALFVVLDPFQYSMNLPYSNVTGSGEANDETVSGDQWNWTLGKKQYNWLKQTLENSTARYKFVFSHHVTGGQLTISNSSAGPATYVRGGAMAANYFEWGGLNANGTEGFGSKRVGWNGDPVHQLLVENNVTAYFHGHDHQFVHEEIDGVVYQLVPTPGMEGYGFDLYDSSPYAQSGGNLPDPGHIRVTVSPEEALLEYVRSETGGGGINGQIAYSYTMEPVVPESSITVTSPNGSEKWHIGSDHAVTWTSAGLSGNIHIEYSTNNGTSWTDIVSSTENDGSYVWTIPNFPSTSCLVRVSELDGNPVDMSNAVFEIYNLPEHHFVPVPPANNGYDHMNFYALTAKINGEDLQPGDEIGIFDNSVCVGAGEITQILDGQDIYLPIKISRDDPDVSGIDGYTAGNQASFRLWDESEEKEISTFSITYESGNSVFTPGASCWYYINGETSQEEQHIELQSGWNIFSLYVTPENINLMAIVQPLIDAGRLIKVQDETGEAIEKHPVTHNWFNDIGDWGVTEGYKINVSVDTVLIVTGSPVSEAVNIDLLEGWNIISYPVSIPEDGMSIVSPLITAGSLIKVQDEDGDAIEQNPVQDTWFNDIGLFDADEGYKVHVNTPANLVIDPSDYGSGSSFSLKKMAYPVYAPKSTLKSAEAKHFKPIWSGNGTDHMNIYISETSGGDTGLMPGDEIGIFDGMKCVGSGVISDTAQHYYAFVASSDDPVTKSNDGFTDGNPIAIKLWKSSENREVSIPNPNFFPGTKKVFEAMETSVIALNSADLYLATGDEGGAMLGKIYPNPFRNGTNIPFTLAARTEVSISVYNMIGQQVITLVQATLDQGLYNVYWDGTDETQTGLLPGIYTVKMVAGNKISVQRIILIK